MPSASIRCALVAFLAMCFGMFMAFLDIQVVSASLSEIQAGLAASSDEITWVQTSYLMAEVVAIPLSGFLSRALGTRVMFATAAAGFTVASLMCGLSLVDERDDRLARAAGLHRRRHGADGVRLRLYHFSALALQPVITPMIGLVATLAPTIGPTVGGYLTDTLSWHWLFFINIVPGIMVTIAAITLIDFDKPDYSLFERFDWIGLIFMALFLGALEYVLEDGPRYDWFEDPTIALAAVVSAARRVIFFVRVLTARTADRRPARLCRPQFRARQHVLVRARHRPLRPDLPLPGLSRRDPRLQRAHDRQDHVRFRRDDVPDRPARRPADVAGRCAPDARLRLRRRRASATGRQLLTSRLGFLANSSCRRSCAASA